VPAEETAINTQTIKARHSLVIEATEDPNFFGFYSSDLEGFTGVGHSIEDCLYKARWGMEEHVALLRERDMPVPQPTVDPKVTIQNAKAVLTSASAPRT
jgi:predicted RNase H-like HicB family nuclease